MKERKKLKEIYSRHKIAIQSTILIIFTILIFIDGYLFSWNSLEKPLNDSQLKLCEQVAQDVYAQKGNVILEIPEDFSVHITTTTITVQLTDVLYRGKVIAKLQNGELVMTRNMETEKAVFLSIAMGIICVLVALLILTTYSKIQKNLGK